MRLRLQVVPQAERQLRAAASWWHENRPAAPTLFRDELKKAFDLIAEQPSIGPRARDVRAKDVRRLHLSRLRYLLYYRIHGDLIQILACWHVSRGSAPDL